MEHPVRLPIRPLASVVGSEQPGRSGPVAYDQVLTAGPSESFVRRVVAADLPFNDSLWKWYLQQDEPTGLFGKLLGSDGSTFLFEAESTFRDLSTYFGESLTDPEFRLAVWPAEGLGGGGTDGPDWLLFAQGFLDLARNGLEAYGAVDVARRAAKYVQGRASRPARNDVYRWASTGGITRRLSQYVTARDEWDAKEFTDALCVSPSEAALLLRACGYELVPNRPTTWRRRRSKNADQAD